MSSEESGSLADQAAAWVPPWARPSAPPASEETATPDEAAEGRDEAPDEVPDALDEVPEATDEAPEASDEAPEASDGTAEKRDGAPEALDVVPETAAVVDEPVAPAAVETPGADEPIAVDEQPISVDEPVDSPAVESPEADEPIAVDEAVDDEPITVDEPETNAPSDTVEPTGETPDESEPPTAVDDPADPPLVEADAPDFEGAPRAPLAADAPDPADLTAPVEPQAEDSAPTTPPLEPNLAAVPPPSDEPADIDPPDPNAAPAPADPAPADPAPTAPTADLAEDEPPVPVPGNEQPPLDDPVPELSEADLQGAVEAILLVVDEPTTEIILAQILEQPTDRITAMLEKLVRDYTDSGRGFELRRVAGGWRLYTRPEYAAYVEKFVLDGQQVRLTQAALETLAVIAYKQPVSRSRISAIRGVNCDGVVRTLVTRGLIEECGSEPESGAFLYRTTTLFLEKLGLDGVDQLPPLAPFLPDDIDEIADAQR